MSRLTRDGTAESVSRDQNIICPVQLTTSRIDNLTPLILALAVWHDHIHTYIQRQNMRHFTRDGTEQCKKSPSKTSLVHIYISRANPIDLDCFLKKNLNASTVVVDLLNISQSEGKIAKRLGGIIGCKDKTSS